MKKFIDDIEKFGWSVVMIRETEYLPAFAYTVGIWEKFGKPEIIAFGLDVDTLQCLVNDAGNIFKSGNEITLNRSYDDFLENLNVQFVDVNEHNISDYFGFGIEYYGSKHFPAIQLIWPDHYIRFPWDKDFETELNHRQPLLDRNMNFKFREDYNLAVFTTKQFTEGHLPVVRVSHDDDGDWQFLTKNAELTDAKIVHLSYMTNIDKTLNEVFQLEYGQTVERDFVGGSWRLVNDL